jgi:hypothetical protein
MFGIGIIEIAVILGLVIGVALVVAAGGSRKK